MPATLLRYATSRSPPARALSAGALTADGALGFGVPNSERPLQTLAVLAAVAGAAVLWHRHTTSRLVLPPDVRQLDNPRAMARAQNLFRRYQQHLEHGGLEVPEDLRAAAQEVRSALLLVMLYRARRKETTPEMLRAARTAYATLGDHGSGARRKQAVTSPQGTTLRERQEQEFLRSEIAASQLATWEFDTRFRSGLGTLGVDPTVAGWDIPDEAAATADEVERELKRLGDPAPRTTASPASAADGGPSSRSISSDKAAWWRARIAEPPRERVQTIFARLAQAVDEERREELSTKVARVAPHYVAILRRVGGDRLEAERRRMLCLVIDNYRDALIAQIDQGETMDARTWDVVSALLGSAAAIEMVLLQENAEVFERAYTPGFALAGPPMGADLMREELERR